MTHDTIIPTTARRIKLSLTVLPLIAATLCAGCGLAGTAVATGTGAAAEVQQAQQAKATEDQVQRQLQQAHDVDAQQHADAESQGK